MKRESEKCKAYFKKVEMSLHHEILPGELPKTGSCP